MNDNVVRDEVLYTYEAAINRYERERHHAWLCRQKRLKEIRKEQQEERRYFCNQKMCGLFLVLLSVILLLLTYEGLTIIGIVIGIHLIITKKMFIYNEYYRTHGGAEQWK